MSLTQDDIRAWHEVQCKCCKVAIWAKGRRWREIPWVVCLCGSTRFMDAWKQAEVEAALAGKIVLSVQIVTTQAPGVERITDETKAMLDALHLRKIDLADEVMILNVGGYIGESTANELRYARDRGKKITFLEPDEAPKENA